MIELFATHTGEDFLEQGYDGWATRVWDMVEDRFFSHPPTPEPDDVSVQCWNLAQSVINARQQRAAINTAVERHLDQSTTPSPRRPSKI